MPKLIAALIIVSLAASAIAAQDWRDIDDNGSAFDCDLADRVAAEFGDESIIRQPGDVYIPLSQLLDWMFPYCEHEPNADAGTEIANLLAEAPILNDGMAATSMLPADARYSIDGKDCSVLVTDQFDADFNISVTGHGQDRMSVAVYLPGESEPLAMDHVHNYQVELGQIMPVRTEWAEGKDFPMGLYTFDVQIDDSAYRYQWMRLDAHYNTFELICLFAPEEGNGEFVYRLADGSSLELANSSCSVFSIAWDTDFQVIAGGDKHPDILVEVTFPGADEAAAMEDSEVLELDSGTPFRLEWISGDDFPLGEYKLDVTIDEQHYPVVWDRQDPAYNTVGASCQPGA